MHEEANSKFDNWMERLAKVKATNPKTKSTTRKNNLALFASAWEAVTGGIEPPEQLLAGRKTERFPFLAKALARYREEYPGPDGLGRSDRQLLDVIRSGIHAEAEIFRAFNAREEHPFMGDTMCRRLLEELAKKGLIALQPGENGYFCRIR